LTFLQPCSAEIVFDDSVPDGRSRPPTRRHHPLVGFGTSAPELVTCTDTAFQGSPDIAVGNVDGFDIWVMLAATPALILSAVASWRLNPSRKGGLAGYAGYLGVMGGFTAIRA
jgi:Ca2+/Na+ antiporter